MNEIKQYVTMVDIIAKSKLLETCSDSKNVIEVAEKIKEYTADVIRDLGYTDEKVNSDITILYELYLGRMLHR